MMLLCSNVSCDITLSSNEFGSSKLGMYRGEAGVGLVAFKYCSQMKIVKFCMLYDTMASLPPATKLGQGNIFRSICQEFCP